MRNCRVPSCGMGEQLQLVLVPVVPPMPMGGRKHGGQWEGRTLGPCSAPVFDEEENLLEGAEAFPRCQ